MRSNDEKKPLSLDMTSTQNGELQSFSFDGTIQSKDGSHLIKYVDESGVKTLIKLGDDDSIHLIRSGDHVDHRFMVITNQNTVGTMGNSSFTVVGRRAFWKYDEMSGEIRICYDLPDISNEPMSFNIRIKFTLK